MDVTRILLADDDPEHRSLLTRALHQGDAQVEVHAASSREELLHAAHHGEFACAVLDYNIPPHTAPEIVHSLREILPGLPIIVVSASDDQSVAIESFRTTGVIDFMPKEDAVRPGLLWGRTQCAISDARRAHELRRRAERRLEAMRRVADTDALTGLFNRGYFLRLSRSSRLRPDRRRTTACVMIDLDHFKRVNDLHGHEAGDAVLVHAAKQMRAGARENDVLVRWGGEEFLAILPSASLVDAWCWAEALRQRLAENLCEHGSVSVRVTASFGVAVVPTSVLGTESAAEADRALYLAKEFGRNGVCTADMASAMDAVRSLRAGSDSGAAMLHQRWLGALRSELGAVQYDHLGPHGEAVARMADLLGRRLGLGTEDHADLHLAGLLHDIGKVGVPEEVLAKPGPLTLSERRMVDVHASFGARLARALGANDRVGSIIALHHERFDRSAWAERGAEPRASGVERLARILSVADAIVTMRVDRPYAGARSERQTLAELGRERGRQFSPEVVDAAWLVELPARNAA
ncbi:MAG: diguanylate cyclase [Phycisphaerales bacterium]|nr:diguanylate cyclase [Phycisphaerales bacterium]